ncbi:uncharacterized protein LOC129577049 [Sitodiplosis mosellana]|uniref:uncharacterized protein LOC129577049 n=1 Tax=Sitodiplosis mosellana TaxID=263140 RepID=UPI002445244B|nr:uncharacterized protein LOC129577049 [Sitodiplosis mosellana]XP_055319440.1 uncharacterized protein LOC129577049 [Sitodiplosis mosellana]
MGALSITSCCCFDLDIGGLIIGYLELFIYINNSYNAFSNPFFSQPGWTFLPILICVCWIYGVHSRRIAFMMPSLVVWAIAFIICTSLLIIFPFVALACDIQIHEHLPVLMADHLTKYTGAVFFAALTIWAIISAIIWFITAVKYSLYKQMQTAIYGRNADVYTECINVSV